MTSRDGHVRGITTLAGTREEILEYAGSTYVDTPVIDTIKQIKNDVNRVAVVALPCQARILKSQMARDPELRLKLFPIIGLFCRGNVTEKFYENFFNRFRINQAEIDSIRVKRSHIKGNVFIRMQSGAVSVIPFMTINSYRMAGIHAKALCCWCDEHTAESADIGVGDIFMKEFKKREIKHSAFVAHTPEANSLLQTLQQREIIKAEYVGWANYKEIFGRVEKYSDTLASRCLAARIVNLKSPKCNKKEKINLFHVLSWVIFFQIKKFSESESGGRFLFSLPSPVISFFAFLIKGLSRL